MGTLRRLAVWNAGAMDMVDFLNASFGDIFSFIFSLTLLPTGKPSLSRGLIPRTMAQQSRFPATPPQYRHKHTLKAPAKSEVQELSKKWGLEHGPIVALRLMHNQRQPRGNGT